MVPPRGIKKSGGQKRAPTYGVFEIKKLFSRGTIKEKEIKLGPHRGSPYDPATGDKEFVNQQRSTLGVFLKSKKFLGGGPS